MNKSTFYLHYADAPAARGYAEQLRASRLLSPFIDRLAERIEEEIASLPGVREVSLVLVRFLLTGLMTTVLQLFDEDRRGLEDEVGQAFARGGGRGVGSVLLERLRSTPSQGCQQPAMRPPSGFPL